MAGKNAAPPQRVLLDTNVFIIGFSEELGAEKNVLHYVADHRTEMALLLSDEMQDQLLRVAKRVKGKDWAGLLLSYLWRDFDIQYVNLDDAWDLATLYHAKIPTEDLMVFLTALSGQADCLVSRNRRLLKAALGQNPPLLCLTPEEFLARYASEWAKENK